MNHFKIMALCPLFPMRITSSIVTYKTDVAELQKCLACLLGDSVGKVYVCDNSPDDSLKGVCESYPDVTYIHLPENPGYGTAHNVAMRKAMEEGSTYHLVINSDVWFDKGVIASIAAFMDANPDVGQLAPKMLARDGSLQYSARKLPTPFEVFTKRFLPESFFRSSLNFYLLADWNHNAAVDVPFHQGSFMFFRVAALHEVGLFDERFFMYTEDIDLSRRMHKKFRTLYWPEVSVTHLHRAESYTSFRMMMVHITSMIRYFNKWGWIIDRERKELNKRLKDELVRLKQR